MPESEFQPITTVPDLVTPFARLLPPIVSRSRRTLLQGIGGGRRGPAGCLEGLAVKTLEVLTSPAFGNLTHPHRVDALARHTGARVILGERLLRRAGSLGPEAFERAFLVAMLCDLRRHWGKPNRRAIRTYWEAGLPVCVAGSPEDPDMLFLAGRAAERSPGEGIALGYARRGGETSLELLVPETHSGVRRIHAIQVLRRP